MFDQQEIHETANTLDITELANKYGRRLYQFISKRVRNESDAEDIMQATYVECIRHAHMFRGDSRPETWLFGIAVNLVRNHISRSAERAARIEFYDLTDEEFSADFISPNSDPSEEAEQRIALDRVRSALPKLPLEMREVLRLVIDEDCSYEEAANRMAVPVGTIRSRLSRARSLLREHMATIEQGTLSWA